jgi:tRNA(Ile)-lysidine synthase
VRETIAKYEIFTPGVKVVVGVSGGPDSLCLLHLLHHFRGELGIILHVAHLHHALRGEEADEDARFVENLAISWGLPSTVEKRDVPAYAKREKLAIEEAARQVRYTFLAKVARGVGASSVAVGHNADDQVETIIMHWLRGAGTAGLRGMRPVQRWPLPSVDLRLVRPLLEIPRGEIEAYCQEHHLTPRYDRSNLDTTYYRNRIRHELLPLLEKYNPNIREVLRRAALIIADDHDYLAREGQKAWEKVVREMDGTLVFDLKAWDELHSSLQRQLLRQAIRNLRSDLRNIDWVHIEEARRALGEKPAGTEVTLPRGLSLFRSYETFVIGDTLPIPEMPLIDEEMGIAVPGRTALPDGSWEVICELLAADQGKEEALNNEDPWQGYLDLDQAGQDLILRRRKPGDRFQPLGMGGRSKPLREFMIDAKIPHHIRDRLPLVVSPQNIVWVAGHRVDERARVTERTERVLKVWFQKRT